jgi:hypothetical protein
MDSIETRLAVIEERVRDNKDQIGRTSSHVVSEQRVSHNHEKRIDALEKGLERLDKRHVVYDTILFNAGVGVVVKLDRIIQRELQKENDSKKFQWTFSNIMAIVSIVGNLILGWLVYNK